MVHKLVRLGYIGDSGIKNKGNTCFFNSSLQALLSMPKLVHFFVETSFDPSKQFFCVALQNFILQYRKSDLVDPEILISALRKKIKLFDGRQQDAHSFFESFISHLSDEIEGISKEKKSYIKQLLKIELEDILTCHECNYQSITNTVSMIQFLFMRNTVQDSINSYQKEKEMIDTASPWKCTGCKRKSNASMMHSIKSTSDYLVIYLNRFRDMYSKNEQAIKLDEEIRINEHVYELISTVCHSGTLSGGHYWSYCKRFDVWNEYNDSQVQKIKKPEDGSHVYFLIYSKK